MASYELLHQCSTVFSFMQEVRKDYESDGWKRHHDQGLEFEECEDAAITLSIAGPKSEDDKWELLPMTPLKVRNLLQTYWHCSVLTGCWVAIDQETEGGLHAEVVPSSSLPAGH